MPQIEPPHVIQTDARIVAPVRTTLYGAAAAVFVLVTLLVVLFAQVMSAGLHRDEYGYIVSGVLMREAALYGDFGYNHMPYLPMVFHLADQVLAFTHYHLAGRSLAFLFAGAVMLAGYAAARQLARSRVIALGLAALLVVHPLTVGTVGRVVKDYPAIAFTLLAVTALATSTGPWACFGAGVCLAVATGFKLYYVLFTVPVMALWALRARDLGPKGLFIHRALPFGLGFLLGALPLLGVLFQFPEAFKFNNIDYHLLNKAWYAFAAEPEPIALSEKLAFIGKRAAVQPAIGGLFVGVGLAGLLAIAGSARPTGTPPLVLTGSALGIALGAAFLPSPSFIHHYLVVLPIGAVFFAACYGHAAPARRRWLAAVLGGMLATALFATHGALAVALGRLPDASRWTPMQVHAQALDLAALVPAGHGRVATLAPLFPIEGGLVIYPELSTGTFFYRVGDMVSATERDRRHMTSPRAIAELLRTEPPVAILTGFEPALERPLVAFGLSEGYLPVKLRTRDISLLIRPERAPAAPGR